MYVQLLATISKGLIFTRTWVGGLLMVSLDLVLSPKLSQALFPDQHQALRTEGDADCKTP